MSDTVKRETVIATINTMYECCDTGDITDYRDLMLEAVETLPSADRPQWIPCSVRMPSNSDDVLITIKGDDFVASGTYAGYHSEQWWYLGEDGEITDVPITADILAWMPLPKPWKGADDE